MKQLKLNNRDYVFVPVPDEAYEFEIRSPKIDSYFRFNYRTESNVYHGMAFLFKDFGGRAKYPISMEFIAATDTITEEQAKGIVSKYEGSNSEWYVDYMYRIGLYDSAIDSFQSLLKHHSLTGRYAIIEKI